MWPEGSEEQPEREMCELKCCANEEIFLTAEYRNRIPIKIVSSIVHMPVAIVFNETF